VKNLTLDPIRSSGSLTSSLATSAGANGEI